MKDAKGAREEIAMIKVAVPSMALQVLDRAMQAHGGAGVSQEFELAYMYAQVRTLRFADGPDEVHQRTIARMELAKMPNVEEKTALFEPDSSTDLRPNSVKEYATSML